MEGTNKFISTCGVLRVPEYTHLIILYPEVVTRILAGYDLWAAFDTMETNGGITCTVGGPRVSHVVSCLLNVERAPGCHCERGEASVISYLRALGSARPPLESSSRWYGSYTVKNVEELATWN